MDERTPITEETVRAMAMAADLPLSGERERLLAPQLAEWLSAANSLSHKMSAEEHWSLAPATVFAHPVPLGGEE